jgi:signal transduction histidine kinase
MLNKLSFFKGKLEESKILFIYRYISLLITSIFYLLNQPEHTIGRKIIIIGCLSVAAIILSYLYLIFENSTSVINKLLLIETLGNSVLLIPSGGISSPFIWYTLNTILISSVFLNYKYCLINILSYICIITTIIYFSTEIRVDYLNLIRNESSLILSLIMIIAAIQVLAIYVKKTKEKSKSLEEVNKQLESANLTIMDSIDHIKALYQSINILTNQGNKEGIIKLLFDNVKKITKTNLVFYYDMTEEIYKMISDGDSSIVNAIAERILSEVKNLLDSKEPVEISLYSKRFILMKVESNYSEYGILGFESNNDKESIIYKDNLYQIEFLSELISFAFERFYLEEISDRLLISEEQNRIANEIHDSVLQRLFSMSCGIFALMKKVEKISSSEIENELDSIRSTTDSVMKELREKIYGLSWKRFGLNSFKSNINKYIEEIKRYNDINIPFYIKGNEELLSISQKKAFYRMICEGVGNAVRHGKPNNIDISLEIEKESVELNIIDDGVGFDLSKLKTQETKGLGIQNLYQLTEFLNGDIKIISARGKGTRIEVDVPINGVKEKGEEATV